RDNREQVQIWWCSCLRCYGNGASGRPRPKSVAMQCTYAPEIFTRRKKIRRDHEIRAGDARKKEHAETSGEVWVGIDVEIVAGHLRIRGIRPIEKERKLRRSSR